MPDTPPRPSAASIVLMLLVAAVVGFLGGALLAVTSSDGEASPVASDATTTPADDAVVTSGAAPGPTAPTSPAPASTDSTISLTADRAGADTEELIRLEGVLAPAAGDVALQVQQSVDGIGFVDFPVTATTRSDGSFGVWVRTGRVGLNEFRMVTEVAGGQVVSNAVAVQVS